MCSSASFASSSERFWRRMAIESDILVDIEELMILGVLFLCNCWKERN